VMRLCLWVRHDYAPSALSGPFNLPAWQRTRLRAAADLLRCSDDLGGRHSVLWQVLLQWRQALLQRGFPVGQLDVPVLLQPRAVEARIERPLGGSRILLRGDRLDSRQQAILLAQVLGDRVGEPVPGGF